MSLFATGLRFYAAKVSDRPRFGGEVFLAPPGPRSLEERFASALSDIKTHVSKQAMSIQEQLAESQAQVCSTSATSTPKCRIQVRE